MLCLHLNHHSDSSNPDQLTGFQCYLWLAKWRHGLLACGMNNVHQTSDVKDWVLSYKSHHPSPLLWNNSAFWVFARLPFSHTWHSEFCTFYNAYFSMQMTSKSPLHFTVEERQLTSPLTLIRQHSVAFCTMHISHCIWPTPTSPFRRSWQPHSQASAKQTRCVHLALVYFGSYFLQNLIF